MPQRYIASWATPTGILAAYSSVAIGASAVKPLVLFIHGALRNAGVLEAWFDILADEADVVLLDLPGHGRSSPINLASVENIASIVGTAIQTYLPGRRILLVGESIGGTIALRIGGATKESPIKAVFAADPPMTTAKLWNVMAGLRLAAANEPSNEFIINFARDTFGLTFDGYDDLIYYPLLGELRVPTVIATGDLPLLPPRKMSGISCVFDKVDEFVSQKLYGDFFQFKKIRNCDHLLLINSTVDCREIILKQLHQM